MWKYFGGQFHLVHPVQWNSIMKIKEMHPPQLDGLKYHRGKNQLWTILTRNVFQDSVFDISTKIIFKEMKILFFFVAWKKRWRLLEKETEGKVVSKKVIAILSRNCKTSAKNILHTIKTLIFLLLKCLIF